MDPYVMSIIWAVVFISAIVIEAASVEMVAIWFMPGALAAFVLSFFGVYEWVQCIVFVGITAVLLIVAMPIFRKYLKKWMRPNGWRPMKPPKRREGPWHEQSG